MVTEFDDIEEDEDEIDIEDISVQVLYRPVLQQKVPGIPSTNPDDPDYKWWKEQIHRCLHGWVAPNGHYLCGYMYFYLNFCKIPIRLEGDDKFTWDSPLYRDNDEDIVNQIWQNTYRVLPNGKSYNAVSHVEAKPRGVAWTTFTLLGVGTYTFIFKNDAQMGIAYPNDQVIDTEREWFKESWTLLHPIFKRWEGKELTVIQDSRKGFGVGYTKAKIKTFVSKCRFDIIGQEKKAGVYKGKRMNLMIAAEAGLWVGNSLKNYITENEPSARLGKDQWGMFLIGGTSNALINKSTAYKEIFVNPEAYNATRHFTPKTKVLRGHVNYHTGKSNEETALAEVTALRQSKMGDPNAYHQEIIENPLTWEEAFLPNNKVSAYNTAVIQDQIANIEMNHLNKWVRGRLEYLKDAYNRNTGKVVFDEDPEGDWYLNREGYPTPIYKNLHVAAIDDRYKSHGEDHKASVKDSRNAMVIYRKPTTYDIKSDMPVCVYYGNAPDMVVAYEEFYKGMLFYDIPKTLYEYNAEGFIMFMRSKNALDRLYYHNGNPGIKIKTAQEKAELTYLGTQWFTAGRHKNVTLPLIMTEIEKWGTGVNTDISSAMHLVFKILELTENTNVTIIDKSKQNETVIIQLGKGGTTVDISVDLTQLIQLGRAG